MTTKNLTPAMLKAVLNESVKVSLAENKSVQKVMLESRLVLINEMIDLDEADFLDRARKWIKNKYYGAQQAASNAYQNKFLVNPEQMMNDPRQVQGLMDKAIAKAKKDVTSFKADALRSSQAINQLQNTVFDMFGKFFNVLDSLPPESKGKYEREVMQVMGMFYKALMEEKKRIEVYLSALAREAGTQGYNLGQSAEAMASFSPEARPRVVGSRVVDPEETPDAVAGTVGA